MENLILLASTSIPFILTNFSFREISDQEIRRNKGTPRSKSSHNLGNAHFPFKVKRGIVHFKVTEKKKDVVGTLE